MTRGFHWLCAALLLCITPPLAAQDKSDGLIARGVELRKQGKNAEALLEFQLALQQHPSPRARAQVALAQQALGAWVEAEAGLISALEARDDTWIQHNLGALSTALDTVRKHLATLHLETLPPGAALFVNGQPAGTFPGSAALRVAAGVCVVEARLSGYVTAQQTVTAPAGGELSTRLELNALSTPMAAAPTAATPAAATSAGSNAGARNPAPIDDGKWAPPPITPDPSSSHDSGSALRTVGVASLVAAGLFLAGAITAHVIFEYRKAEYNDPARCKPSVNDCSAVRHVAVTAQPLAVAGYAAAGATLVTGIVLLVVGANGNPSPHNWQASLDPSGCYLQLRHSF